MTTMNSDSESTKLREAMVVEMIETAGLNSLSVIHAFSQIPRERFVPSFLERTSGKGWMTVSPSTIGDEAYLQKIYTDTPLIVQVDHRGWPCSSSSMPSVMAMMLEGLDVSLGSNVLELGTGTGYNAALLSFLAHDASCITTIDCENAQDLSAHARQTLAALVGPVHVVIGDGFQGVLSNAPYDRIIATASAPTIPGPWIEQLTPGGLLVMDLQGPLESGFLVFQKNKNGRGGHGHFLDRPLHFIPLVSGLVPTIFIDPHFQQLLQEPHQHHFLVNTDDIFPNILLQDHAFRWFLQWSMPSCCAIEHPADEKHHIFVIVSDHQSILRFTQTDDGWTGDVFGQLPLWKLLQEAFRMFIQLQSPQQTEYIVEIDKNGSRLVTHGFSLPFR